MENQDQLIQDLLNHLKENGPIYSQSYRKTRNINQYEWDELIEVALNNDFIADMDSTRIGSFKIRPKGEYMAGNKYLQLKKDQRTIIEQKMLKDEERERKESKKLDSELLLMKWQKLVFWPVLIGGGAIGGICGIISLWIQLNGK